jgi:hypothetical protein
MNRRYDARLEGYRPLRLAQRRAITVTVGDLTATLDAFGHVSLSRKDEPHLGCGTWSAADQVVLFPKDFDLSDLPDELLTELDAALAKAGAPK